jgi:hypothetical protein
MKQTYRDNWRVVAVLNPMQTHLDIGTLGFTDKWGDPLEGNLWGKPIELEIHPRRLGDLGGVSMSDSLASRDIDGDYRKRCETIRDGMLQHRNVIEARIEVDETHVCSHCGHVWEELTEEDAKDTSLWVDKHTRAGEPLCCGKAVEEFRRENRIPLPKENAGG